uniref:Uncharacterized protein n=1 Tax=Romanomermis culicivorax TaxID=13658 RepID=A0A915J4L5_ROMCU
MSEFFCSPLFGGRFRRCDFQMSIELTALPQQILNFFCDPMNDTIVKGSYKIVSCVKLDHLQNQDNLLWIITRKIMSEKSVTLIIVGSSSGLTTGCKNTRKRGRCQTKDHSRSCKIFFNKDTYEKLIKNDSLLTVMLNKTYGHFETDDRRFCIELAAFPAQIINFFADRENKPYFKGTFRVVSCTNLTSSSTNDQNDSDSDDDDEKFMWTLEKNL